MQVFIEKQNKTIEINAKSVSELLKKLNINKNSVIVVRNNDVILEDEALNDEDNIKLLSVISGG